MSIEIENKEEGEYEEWERVLVDRYEELVSYSREYERSLALYNIINGELPPFTAGVITNIRGSLNTVALLDEYKNVDYLYLTEEEIMNGREFMRDFYYKPMFEDIMRDGFAE